MEIRIDTYEVKDEFSSSNIGQHVKVNNSFGAMIRHPSSNLVVPLSLWKRCDDNNNPAKIWIQAVPTLIQTLETLLDKQFVRRKKLVTLQGIKETIVTIGDRGVELAINSSLIIPENNKGNNGLSYASISMLISPDTVSHGWTSPIQFCNAHMPTPHHYSGDIILKNGSTQGEKCLMSPLPAKKVHKYCRVLLYAGMLSALKSKDIRSAWVIGQHIPKCLLLDKNEEGCIHMFKFLLMIYTMIGPKSPTKFVHFITHSLAEVYEAIGNFPDAIQCYKRCAVVCRFNSMTVELSHSLNNLALCYKRNFQYRLAISSYEKALISCEEANCDPKDTIMNAIRMRGEYRQSSEFSEMTIKKQAKFIWRGMDLLKQVFAGCQALHPTLEPFWADLEKVWADRKTDHQNGTIKVDRVIHNIQMNNTTKTSALLSENGVLYAYVKGKYSMTDIVGKWDRKQKKCVPIAIGQLGWESMNHLVARFAKQGITLKYKSTWEQVVFCEITNLGRTWAYIKNETDTDSVEIVELPCFAPDHTFAPMTNHNTCDDMKNHQAESNQIQKETAKELLRIKSKQFKKLGASSTCALCGAVTRCDKEGVPLKDGKKDLLKCSRCKCVCYCSKEHQRADWSSHKKVCKKK